MGFLFSVNVYVFIPMVLFLWLQIIKNCQKWVLMEMGEIFLLETLKSCPKEQQNTLLIYMYMYDIYYYLVLI